MEAYDITKLLKMFRDKPEIFICGPSYGDTNKPPKTKLRVYAHGGVLCELPTEPRTEIKLLDKKYLPKDSSLYAALNGLRGNEKKEKFLQDHLDDLLPVVRDRFTSKKGGIKERNQQTAISRTHSDFGQHDSTVVCDFESSLPKSMGQPNFDLVTFSLSEKVLTLVEYKCNARACGGKNGLAKHAKDMLECMNNPTTRDWCKKELLRRLGYMCRYDLLKNYPDKLKCVSPDLRSEDLKLRAAFLFTPGEGLKCSHDAAELCRTYIPEKDLDKFLYCFAGSPKAVDLSDMKGWDAFSGNQ